MMGGHAFPIAAFVSTPFAASFVAVSAGFEYHRVPGFTKPTALFGTAGQERVNLVALSVTETVDFELRLLDFLALVGGGYGRVRAGVNTPTLLGDGGDYRYGGDAGLLLKLLRVDNFQLALRGQGGYYVGQQAGILGLFQDLGTIVNGALASIQQNPTADLNTELAFLNAAFRSATSELLTPFTGYRYGGSVNGALALGRYFGAQLALGVFGDHGDYRPRVYDPTLGTTISGPDRASDSLRGRGALALDANAAPAGFPFDFMVEYAMSLIRTSGASQSSVFNGSSIEHLLAVGVYYSGRSDLQLGGTLYTLLGQVPLVGSDGSLSGKPQDFGAQLVFHYIW